MSYTRITNGIRHWSDPVEKKVYVGEKINRVVTLSDLGRSAIPESVFGDISDEALLACRATVEGPKPFLFENVMMSVFHNIVVLRPLGSDNNLYAMFEDDGKHLKIVMAGPELRKPVRYWNTGTSAKMPEELRLYQTSDAVQLQKGFSADPASDP